MLGCCRPRDSEEDDLYVGQVAKNETIKDSENSGIKHKNSKTEKKKIYREVLIVVKIWRDFPIFGS